MVDVTPVQLAAGTAIGIRVDLPKTRVLCITTPHGYIMCGVLNVEMLDRLHPERQIVAASVIGVREISDLLDAKVHEVTKAAAALGVAPGMTGREALDLIMAGGKAA